MRKPLLALLLGASLAGCATTKTTEPLAAVDAYAAALRAHDYDKAYGLMSDKFKQEHSKDEFVKMLKDSPEEVAQTADKLTAGKRHVEVAAHFVYDDLHDELSLVQEGGAWRIATNPLDFYPQDTPQDALRSFVRAVQLKRYDVVLRFVPNEFRDKMTEDEVRKQFEGEKHEEVENMMRLLESNLDNPIEIKGDDARMQYGERYEVTFKKEDNVWKIVDPD